MQLKREPLVRASAFEGAVPADPARIAGVLTLVGGFSTVAGGVATWAKRTPPTDPALNEGDGVDWR